MALSRKPQSVEYFLAHLSLTPDAKQCDLWRGPYFLRSNGRKYGRYMLEGREHTVHRIAAYLSGVMPRMDDFRYVKQTCGKTLCCNPQHLRMAPSPNPYDPKNADMEPPLSPARVPQYEFINSEMRRKRERAGRE